MKKYIFTLASILSVAIILLSYSSKDSRINIDTTTLIAKNKPLYTVADYNGLLAVYKYNSKEPVEIFDIYINTLPEEDYKRLNKGISIYSDTELNSVLEDYTS